MHQIYGIAAIVGVGGFFLGYDVGIISGVLAMDGFADVFGTVAVPGAKPKIGDWDKGFIITSFVLGCLLGASSSSFGIDRFGRRATLVASASCFCVGGMLQAFCSSLPALYGTRFVSGAAVGLSSAVVPLFICELAPAHLRGRLITFNQLSMTGGIMVAFWVNVRAFATSRPRAPPARAPA